MRRFASVDEFMASVESWQAELHKLRSVLCSLDLEETLKWSLPCYTHGGKNVVGLGAFKAYCGLWFFQGALLADKEGVLVNAQDGKTKAMRQWRFRSLKEIKVRTIKAYVREAMVLAAEGAEIKPDRQKPVVVPDELETALSGYLTLDQAFGRLTKGKQREFAEYIAEAKRDATKIKRLEKILPMIRQGIGLNDKYRNC